MASDAAEQTALRRVLEFSAQDNGSYAFEFPLSVAFGFVVSGGIVMSAIHKTAADFVSRDPKTASFSNVLNMALQFYRPVFPGPQKTVIEFKLSNGNKAGATLHVQVLQAKVCIAGYLTMGVFFKNDLFAGVGCELAPPTLPTTIANLENDVDDGWSGYRLPFAIAGNRNAITYIRYHTTKQMQSPNFVDQWVTPAWQDDGLPGGPVWTDELVHYLVDSSTPLWLDPAARKEMYKNSILAGQRQAQARRDGASEIVDGGELRIPYMAATLSINTTVRRRLPPAGAKWLFMRATTTGHANNRSDYFIIVMDPDGQVIATSNQVMMLIPHSGKEARL